MQIVVNHVTRMDPGFVCLAGIQIKDVPHRVGGQASGGLIRGLVQRAFGPASSPPPNVWRTPTRHIRPTAGQGRLSRNFLRSEGGAFDIGAVIDLGPVVYEGRPPEVEDHRFDPSKVRHVRQMPGDHFWSLLEAVSKPTLGEVFGPDLKPNGSGCTVDMGEGIASLGCLRPAKQVAVEVNAFGKLRVKLTDDRRALDLSITDLRLYEADQKSLRLATIGSVQRHMRSGSRVILSVGLTRAWQKPGDSVARHWLQVNNIHLQDDPLWS